MKTNKKQMQFGRKTWYGLAIILSVLVILVSVAGVVGSWVGGSTLSAATVQVLLVVEGTADNMSTLVDGIDLRVAGLEETSLAIRDATDQLSQNVTDKGLVLTLLPEERETTPADIIRFVAQHYGIRVADLKGRSNRRSIALPRQVAMYLIREILELSFPEIGKTFSKHHSTVMYAVDAISKMRLSNPDFDATLTSFREHFN